MAIETIFINGISHPVNIKHNKVKGIIVKINPLGEILVKANPRYNLKYILEYLSSINDWLDKKLSFVLKNKQHLSIDKCLQHKLIWLFGQLYEIKTNDNLIMPFTIIDNSIYFSSKDIISLRYLKIVREFNHDVIKNKFYDIFKSLNYKTLPNLEFNYYKSRWGVCFPKQNKIILNERLCHLPDDLIKLVILHEIAHLRIHNHSQKFYQELNSIYPKYKEAQKRLAQYSFVLMKEY